MSDLVIVSKSEIEKVIRENVRTCDSYELLALLDKATPCGEPMALMSIKISQLIARVVELEDLLSSAYNIANRNGKDTHWLRFSGKLHAHGISPVTAKTFKILPSDDEYTTPQVPVSSKAFRDAKLYQELIYNVSKKYPNETRHETALRYIRQAENQPDQAMLTEAMKGQ